MNTTPHHCADCPTVTDVTATVTVKAWMVARLISLAEPILEQGNDIDATAWWMLLLDVEDQAPTVPIPPARLRLPPRLQVVR